MDRPTKDVAPIPAAPSLGSLNVASGVFLLLLFVLGLGFALIQWLGPGYEIVKRADFVPWINDNPYVAPVDKPADRMFLVLLAVFAVIGPVVLLAATRRFRGVSPRVRKLLGVSALTVVVGEVLAALARETRGLSVFWPGFSALQVGLALAIVVVVCSGRARRLALLLGASRAMTLGAVLGGVVVVVYAPLMIQAPHGVRDPYHASFITDELLAPAIGHLDGRDYVAQYTWLLGVPIVPLIRGFPDAALTTVATWITLLQFACLWLALLIVRRVSSWRAALAWMLLVVPTGLLINPPEFQSLHVTGYWATFPIRLLIPLACWLLAHRWGPWDEMLAWQVRVLGALGAAAVLNNLDFGAPAALALGVGALVTRGDFVQRRNRIVNLGLGAALVVLVHALAVVLVSGAIPDYRRWGFFAQIYAGKGFFAVPLPAWGFFWLPLATLLAALHAGVLGSRTQDESWPRDLRALSTSLQFAGVFGLGAFLYYMNRALVPVLAGMFVIWSLVLLLLVTFIYRVRLLRHRDGLAALTGIGMVPILFPVVLYATTVFEVPSVRAEWERIRSGTAEQSMYGRADIAERSAGLRQFVALNGLDAGVFAGDGSLLSLRSGVPNLTTVNRPSSVVTLSTARLICGALQASGEDVVVFEHKSVEPQLELLLAETCRLGAVLVDDGVFAAYTVPR